MWILISEDYCVLQYSGTFYVCRRQANGKVNRLSEYGSYQEAEQAFRQLRNRL